MFFASAGPMPATWDSSCAEAVETSTPTWFTHCSTTPSSAAVSSFCFKSCWYWPTPMAFGSIFTSSASGSCMRRAMETALRWVTSKSGNSSAASLLAEYTEAPASLTIM